MANHRRRSWRWPALLLLLAALAGCAVPLRKPELSVVAVELLAVGFNEQTLLLKLNVANPNDRELAIDALDFALEVNGQPLAKGRAEHALSVAANGEGLLEVRAVTRLSDLVRIVREARSGDAPLTYRVFGRAEVAGYGQLPFDRSAQLPRSALERLTGR